MENILFGCGMHNRKAGHARLERAIVFVASVCAWKGQRAGMSCSYGCFKWQSYAQVKIEKSLLSSLFLACHIKL